MTELGVGPGPGTPVILQERLFTVNSSVAKNIIVSSGTFYTISGLAYVVSVQYNIQTNQTPKSGNILTMDKMRNSKSNSIFF